MAAPERKEKPCSKCGVTKKLTEFYGRDRYRRRIFNHCKACHRIMVRKRTLSLKLATSVANS